MPPLLTVTAPAKINLVLSVGPIRPDGFHEVTTVLHTLALHDTVYLSPAPGLSFACSADLGIPVERNLAYRAAEAFAEEFSAPPDSSAPLGASAPPGVSAPLGVSITIEKRIPWGAGLGGGSSDAAAVIAGLAALTGEDPRSERCLAVARQLGADCPFFLLGGAALMEGRGDELNLPLPSVDAHVALVKPSAAVSTAAAYAAFDLAPPAPIDPCPLIHALRAATVDGVAAALGNNMTSASVRLVPEVGEALAWVRAEKGVLGALMAGSGSAVFALCETAADAERIADKAHARGWWGCATTTSRQGVTVAYEEECP